MGKAGAGKLARGAGKQSAGVPRKPGRKKRTSVLCQVPGCEVELVNAKGYYKRYRICLHHSTAPSLKIAGIAQRFCQQCGRFQPLQDFDSDRKSCRERLKRHNRRRQAAKGGTPAPEDSALEEDGDAPSSAVNGPSQPGQAQRSQRRRRPARRTPSFSNTTSDTDAEWSGWSSGEGSGDDRDDDASSLSPTLAPGGLPAAGCALAACGEACARPRLFTHTLQRTDTANSATGLTQQLAELLGPVGHERGPALGAPPLVRGSSGGSLWPAGMVPADELGPARCSETSLADLLAGDGQQQQQQQQQLAAEVQAAVEREEWPTGSGLPPPFQGLRWQQQAAGCQLGAWIHALGGSGLAVAGLPAARGPAQDGCGLADGCARAPSPDIMHWLGLDDEEEEKAQPAGAGFGMQEEGAAAQGGGGQLPPPIPGAPVCEAAAAPCAAKHTAPAASLVAPAADQQPGRDTSAASSEHQHQGPHWQPPKQAATAPAPAPCPPYAGAMSYVAAAAAAMAAAGPAPAPSSARLPGTPLAAAAWGSVQQPGRAPSQEPSGSGACPLFFMDGAGRIRLGLPSASSSTAGTVPLPVLLDGAGAAASRGPAAAAAAPYFSALISAQATPPPCG